MISLKTCSQVAQRNTSSHEVFLPKLGKFYNSTRRTSFCQTLGRQKLHPISLARIKKSRVYSRLPPGELGQEFYRREEDLKDEKLENEAANIGALLSCSALSSEVVSNLIKKAAAVPKPIAASLAGIFTLALLYVFWRTFNRGDAQESPEKDELSHNNNGAADASSTPTIVVGPQAELQGPSPSAPVVSADVATILEEGESTLLDQRVNAPIITTDVATLLEQGESTLLDQVNIAVSPAVDSVVSTPATPDVDVTESTSPVDTVECHNGEVGAPSASPGREENGQFKSFEESVAEGGKETFKTEEQEGVVAMVESKQQQEVEDKETEVVKGEQQEEQQGKQQEEQQEEQQKEEQEELPEELPEEQQEEQQEEETGVVMKQQQEEKQVQNFEDKRMTTEGHTQENLEQLLALMMEERVGAMAAQHEEEMSSLRSIQAMEMEVLQARASKGELLEREMEHLRREKELATEVAVHLLDTEQSREAEMREVLARASADMDAAARLAQCELVLAQSIDAEYDESVMKEVSAELSPVSLGQVSAHEIVERATQVEAERQRELKSHRDEIATLRRRLSEEASEKAELATSIERKELELQALRQQLEAVVEGREYELPKKTKRFPW